MTAEEFGGWIEYLGLTGETGGSDAEPDAEGAKGPVSSMRDITAALSGAGLRKV